MKFIPVTTYGSRFPIDSQIQPHLPNFVDDVMVSYQFAQHMKKRPPLTLWIDSGGYATHRPIARVLPMKGRAGFTVAGEILTPEKVLAFQETHADVGFTLDFILVPDLGAAECTRRYEWTIQNALWAQQHRKNNGMRLYASLQAMCPTTAREAARVYRQQGMDGIGVGGLVPRIHDRNTLKKILEAVLEEAGTLPVHAFGLGTPDLLRMLQDMGGPVLIPAVTCSGPGGTRVGKAKSAPNRFQNPAECAWPCTTFRPSWRCWPPTPLATLKPVVDPPTPPAPATTEGFLHGFSVATPLLHFAGHP